MGCFNSKLSTASDLDDNDNFQWDGHINIIRPWKVDPALSTAHLTRLRKEFWETRVEGQPEMWQALRFAAEAESSHLCNETIKAAGLRPANKKCTLQAMFDERGHLYELPMYALAPPTNLDNHPVHQLFKDASQAVADYIHTHERPKRSTPHR